MTKALKQMLQMKASLWVNSFCYYFKRLWLIGKWMPDSIYGDYGLKKVLSVIAVVVQQLIEFFGKPVYLLCAVATPLLMMSELSAEHRLSALIQILFFLNCVIGAFGDSQIFKVTRDKVACIKYMHMDARLFTQSALALKYIPFFLYYLPWLILSAYLTGGGWMEGLCLWLMLLSFRMMGEAVQLYLFDRTGKVLSRNMAYNWIILLVGLAGAYLPLGLGWHLPFTALLHPIAVLLYVVLGSLSFWYIAVGYRGYSEKLHRSIDLNFLLSSLMKTSSGSAAVFKAVEMKEKDVSLSQTELEKLTHLSGYSYLNALFFARHRRQLVKPVIYRLISVVVLFSAVLVLFFFSPEIVKGASAHLSELLPSFVFIMYFMTVADKAARAMFYNCDKDLLHYAYYRQPQTILKNFQIRLLHISLYDLVIAAAVCLAAVAVRLLCGQSLFTADLLLFCIAILLLSVLFTVHHLCLYYIFQPYSESLQIKNPFFSVINGGMYFLCFLCMQLEVGGALFTAGVLLFTVVYISVALILAYRRAPKSFRIK